jgi:hypothetical protein
MVVNYMLFHSNSAYLKQNPACNRCHAHSVANPTEEVLLKFKYHAIAKTHGEGASNLDNGHPGLHREAAPGQQAAGHSSSPVSSF